MKKIFIVLLVMGVIFASIYIKYKKNLLVRKDILEDKPFNDFDKIEEIFNDRYVLYNNNCVIIGKNKNEIENGYFDFKISINNNILGITLNKIFKSFDEKYNNIFFSNKYLDDIFSLVSYLKFNITNEVKNKCMEEYINLRSSFGSYNIDKYSIENIDIFTKDNMLFLNIHK